MKIKKTYHALILSTMCILFSVCCLGQRSDGPGSEKMKKLLIPFLTEELNLTVEEGQGFWPIFNEMTDERQRLEKEKKTVIKFLRENKNEATEKQVLESLTTINELDKKLSDLHSNFIASSLPILGPKKTIKLMDAERKFKKQLFERAKEQRSNGGNRPGNKK